MGTAIGALAGMALGAAGAVAGYFGGRAIDTRVTHIRVVP